MTWPVRTTTDTITTDSAGRTVEAVPVYATDDPVQNAAGQWVAPAPAEESDVGTPVRYVDALAVQDSTGRWVDATPVSGGAAAYASYAAPSGFRWDFVTYQGARVTQSGVPVVDLVRTA